MLYFNGKPYFVPFIEREGASLPEGLDAIPSQVVEGNKFVGANGVLEEGTLKQAKGVSGSAYISNQTKSIVHFRADLEEPIAVTDYIGTSVRKRSFGNALPEDVRKGVIFTSSAGVKSVGTYEPSVEVEDVDELPDKRIPPKRVYRYQGKYYKYDATNVLVFDENLGANDAYELMNKDYYFEYSVNIPNVGKVRMNEMGFEFDGTYLIVGYHNNEYSLDEAYNERYGWADEMYRTIEIHTTPDDADLNAWLFDVATVEGTWVEYDTTSQSQPLAYTVSSVDELPNDAPDGSLALVESEVPETNAGVWRFNDVITAPNAKFNIFYMLNGLEGDVWHGTLRGDGVNLYKGMYASEIIYSADSGWVSDGYKIMFIGDEQYDEAFNTWLKENAVKLGDVPRGWWRFKDDISFEGINFVQDFFGANTEFETDLPFDCIYDEDNCLIYDGIYASTVAIDEEGWTDNRFKTIFIEHSVNNDFYYWLLDNANKVIPTKLYLRQNGEWVYEREAELGGSGSDGAITEIQTPEELDNILANATASDVGKAYVFVGESNSKYKNGSIYIIREV